MLQKNGEKIIDLPDKWIASFKNIAWKRTDTNNCLIIWSENEQDYFNSFYDGADKFIEAHIIKGKNENEN